VFKAPPIEKSGSPELGDGPVAIGRGGAVSVGLEVGLLELGNTTISLSSWPLLHAA
jgi:hypothetical protein